MKYLRERIDDYDISKITLELCEASKYLGVLEEKINGELGARLAAAKLDKTILVGNTLVEAVKKGYVQAGGDMSAVVKVETLNKAQKLLKEFLQEGDAVLFLNDLPDVY